MIRLRDAAAVVALATGGIGCVTFCDECDDFPVPGRYAAIPGSYTSPPLEGDSTRNGWTANAPSPTATRESAEESVAPPAPSSDDVDATPPPASNSTPFAP